MLLANGDCACRFATRYNFLISVFVFLWNHKGRLDVKYLPALSTLAPYEIPTLCVLTPTSN